MYILRQIIDLILLSLARTLCSPSALCPLCPLPYPPSVIPILDHCIASGTAHKLRPKSGIVVVHLRPISASWYSSPLSDHIRSSEKSAFDNSSTNTTPFSP